MRVLMVEDNKDTLATMAAVLRYERYDLVTAMDGPSALEIAKVFLPEVVLLDIGLPGLDGYRVARALRAQDPRRKLFIAAITGYGTAADKQHAAEAGIDAHLTKPADPTEVLRLLEEFRSRL